MTIASALNSLNQDIVNARTAITNKGGTVTSNGGSSQLATDIATIPSGGSSGKYQLLDRIEDDNNNEIGTVSGFFTDESDTEYAVVCLDAQYRLASGQWCSNTGNVTNLPLYLNANLWSSVDSGFVNTQLILNYCSANNYTSSACTHCRTKSFVIDGTTYYGQLPNVYEISNILKYRVEINTADTSRTQYSSLEIPNNKTIFSSNQATGQYAWSFSTTGGVGFTDKTTSQFIIPILEIPNS